MIAEAESEYVHRRVPWLYFFSVFFVPLWFNNAWQNNHRDTKTQTAYIQKSTVRAKIDKVLVETGEVEMASRVGGRHRPYDSRSTTAGSVCAARRAGRKDASNATETRIAEVIAKTKGSVVLTPNN